MKVIAKSYYDVVGDSQDAGLDCKDASLAVQASKDECDINVIVKKYLRTGELPGLRQMVYADISQMPDLAGAIQMVDSAYELFESLPADVRQFFDHDPTKMASFQVDDSNRELAYKLGLVTQAPPSQPASAPAQPASSGPNVPTT